MGVSIDCQSITSRAYWLHVDVVRPAGVQYQQTSQPDLSDLHGCSEGKVLSVKGEVNGSFLWGQGSSLRLERVIHSLVRGIGSLIQ